MSPYTEPVEALERRRWRWVGLLTLVALVLAIVAISVTGCATAPAPVVVSPDTPPVQASLDTATAEQIAALKAESAAKSAQLDTVAASACAIQVVGLPNTPASDGKGVIEREADVIAAAAGEPTPEARAAALERANAQLRGDLDRANTLYGQATAEAQRLNQQLEAYAQQIAAREAQLDQLRKDAAAERVAAAAKLQATIDAQAKAFGDYKSAEAARTRRLWVNTLRFGGLALVVIGIGIVALTKGLMLTQGGLLALGGVLIVGVGMAYDIVSRQPWFPWAAGLLGLVVLGAAGWAVWHFYKQGSLQTKLAAAMNDLKTEAEAAGSASTDSWKTLQEHLEYRLGPAGSAARTQLSKLWAKLGLDSSAK